MTNAIRERFGISFDKPFPIMRFLEHLPMILGINFEVVLDSEMKSSYAEFFPFEKLIKIRESTYDGACNGNPEDEFTVAHEIGHAFLHTSDTISFARVFTIKKSEDPEWQADTFAEELLAYKTQTIKRLLPEEIAPKYRL